MNVIIRAKHVMVPLNTIVYLVIVTEFSMKICVMNGFLVGMNVINYL